MGLNIESGLSFVTLLSFDYRYADRAINSYYAIADEIILGVDADRLTWMKQPFSIDMEEVRAFIAKIDVAGKIRIVEGNFHAHDHPMANDTGERNFLSEQCRPGHWIVQIDADETLLGGGGAVEFRRWLLQSNPEGCVSARWISIFKLFERHALVIDPPLETTPIATRLRGQYQMARWTNEPVVLSPLQLLHLSWGRTPEELREKLRNWSHSRDFDVEAFFAMWEAVTLENYQALRDFHPIDRVSWPRLGVMAVERTG